jgi:hypothetical protein
MATETNPQAARPLVLENDPFAEGNPYEVLGVPRDADRSEIKSAYRALQKKAKRGDEIWTKAQLANEALTKPKRRLLVDLFVIDEKREYDELVRQYGEVSFEAVPKDPLPLLLGVSDLEWGTLEEHFRSVPVPRIAFHSMTPEPAESDLEVVPFGRRMG